MVDDLYHTVYGYLYIEDVRALQPRWLTNCTILDGVALTILCMVFWLPSGLQSPNIFDVKVGAPPGKSLFILRMISSMATIWVA